MPVSIEGPTTTRLINTTLMGNRAYPPVGRSEVNPGQTVALAERVAVDVAGPSAFQVDLEARFPAEAITALKEARLLSALVPAAHGGMGASLSECSDAIRVIARHCASTACIFAMHSCDVFILTRYGRSAGLEGLLAEIAAQQLLIVNATSEIKPGEPALISDGDGWRFLKEASVSSAGMFGDLITTSMRRSEDAPPSDQILAMLHASDVEREPIGEWDTLGLRGTCSTGLRLQGRILASDIFPVPFGEIAVTGGQVIHILLTAVWVGLAEAALEEALAKVRATARRNVETVPPSASRLAEMLTGVQSARSVLADAVVRFDAAVRTDSLEDAALLISLRNVKVISTQAAVDAASAALQICGVLGYRRGPDQRLERVIRDALGGPIMFGNDRYLAENASLLRMRRTL